jgi:hypothetical protein
MHVTLCAESLFQEWSWEVVFCRGPETDTNLRYALFWDMSGNSLPTFRDNLSVPFSRVKKSKKTSLPLKMEPIGCPETLVQNYHSTLRNIPEEHRCHLHRGGSLKSRKHKLNFFRGYLKLSLQGKVQSTT